MTSMAQHINEMKRKHEHAVRIQEIQSQLSDWDGADLTTYGDLVLEVRIDCDQEITVAIFENVAIYFHAVFSCGEVIMLQRRKVCFLVSVAIWKTFV